MPMTNNQLAEACGTYTERVRTAFKTLEGSKYKPSKQLIWNNERKRFFTEDVWSDEACRWCFDWITRKEKELEKAQAEQEKKEKLAAKKHAERLEQLKKEKPYITDERCFDPNWWPDTYISFGEED